MKVALICGLLLCLLIIFAGVAVWFTTQVWVAKFIASFLCILSGVGFGALGIDLWRDT